MLPVAQGAGFIKSWTVPQFNRRIDAFAVGEEIRFQVVEQSTKKIWSNIPSPNPQLKPNNSLQSRITWLQSLKDASLAVSDEEFGSYPYAVEFKSPKKPQYEHFCPGLDLQTAPESEIIKFVIKNIPPETYSEGGTSRIKVQRELMINFRDETFPCVEISLDRTAVFKGFKVFITFFEGVFRDKKTIIDKYNFPINEAEIKELLLQDSSLVGESHDKITKRNECRETIRVAFERCSHIKLYISYDREHGRIVLNECTSVILSASYGRATQEVAKTIATFIPAVVEIAKVTRK